MRELVSGDWIFPITVPPIPNGALLLEEGRVVDLGAAPALRRQYPGTPERRLPPGAVLPGVINAHTHLELDAVGLLPSEGGFAAWVSRMIAAKETLDPQQAAEQARLSAARLAAAGTACIADISSSLLSLQALTGTGLRAVVFVERIGRDFEIFDSLESEPLPSEVSALLPACHTPFSTAPETFRAARRTAAERSVPWCAHVAESAAETELLLNGRGPLRELLLLRGIASDEIPSPGSRSIAYLEKLGCLDERLLAVHLVEADPGELDLLARRGVTPCLCPSSNLHLLGRLPPVAAMLRAGLEPALGTDSLASGRSLNLFQEMEILLEQGTNPETVLRMGTLNGAEALRLPGDFGRIERGGKPLLIVLPFVGRSDEEPAARAIRAGASGKIFPLVENRLSH